MSLVRDGLLSGKAVSAQGLLLLITNNLRLLPRFNEKDQDTFFFLFERVAKARNWLDADCALMLQIVLSGKTQEAYSSLTVKDSSGYNK